MAQVSEDWAEEFAAVQSYIRLCNTSHECFALTKLVMYSHYERHCLEK